MAFRKNLTGFCIFITIINSFNLQAQQGWYHLYADSNLCFHSCSFIDLNTGWLVDHMSGLILKTTNGGTNWIEQWHYYTNFFFCVYFVNHNIGWTAGGDGLILKTTNSGLNWVRQYGPNNTYNGHFYDIHFINSTTGWVVNYYGGIIKTTNGGLNWFNQLKDFYGLFSLCFLDSCNGWIAGNNGQILKTTNGGDTWSPQNIPVSILFRSIYFKNVNTGWASGDTGKIVHTIDGGNTWLYQNSQTLYNLNSIYFPDVNTGWAVGQNGTIIKSTNGGLNWFSQVSGTTATLWSVLFINNYVGWTMGTFGTLLKTTNGGEPIGIKPVSSNLPEQFYLYQNYPNPFNPVTEINYSIPKDVKVTIKIYDILGREVKILVDEFKPAGYYNVTFDASDLSSGVYFYKIEAGNFKNIKKMAVIK